MSQPVIAPEHAQFLADHRWAVLTTLRASGAPVNSVVAYAQDGDRLLVSTPGATFKRRSIDSDPRVNLCVLTNAEPFNYVAVEGQAEVLTENLEAHTLAVFERLTGTGWETPEDMSAWLAESQRVILRITPQRVTGVIR